MDNTFPTHTPETAPHLARETLIRTQAALGFIPTMYAKQAEAPQLLEAYRTVAALFEQTSLSQEERLVVSMTASRFHECDFCMTAHSWLGRKSGIEDALVDGLRSGEPLDDPRLEALTQFVRAGLEKRGQVTNYDRDAFFAAGFAPRHALEVVLGLAAKVMTNFTNAIADTPPNPEFGKASLWRSV